MLVEHVFVTNRLLVSIIEMVTVPCSNIDIITCLAIHLPYADKVITVNAN